MFKTEIGHKIIHLERVDSTNNYVANMIKENNIEHGTVILADMQTNGRGQRGNKWQSEPYANLTMSIYVRPKQLNANTHLALNHIVSLSLKQLLEKKLNNVNIKWPNDILVGNKKIAGVLIENSWSGSKLKHSIIGIGLNLNQDKFDTDLSTSLYQELNIRFEPRIIALEFCALLSDYFKQLNTNTIPLLKKKYDELLWLKDTATDFIDVHNERFTGIIKGTQSNGNLIIEINNKETSFENGSVTFYKRQ